VCSAIEDMSHHLELQDDEHELLHPDLYSSVEQSSPTQLRGRRSRMRRTLLGGLTVPDMQPPQAVIDEFTVAKKKFDQIPLGFRTRVLSLAPQNPLIDDIEGAFDLLLYGRPEPAMIRAINNSLFSLVRAQYWKQVEHFQVTTSEVDLLLKCVATSLSGQCYDVKDFDTVSAQLELPIEEQQELCKALGTRPINVDTADQAQNHSCVHKVVNSVAFHICIFVAILANAIFALLEDSQAQITEPKAWLIWEAVFMVLFTLEFVLRFVDEGCRYFKKAWNNFDFLLLLLGWACVAVNFVSVNNTKTIQGGNLAQTARVLRIARAVRLARLIRTWGLVRALFAGNIATMPSVERVHRLCILLAFIRAHTAAQQQLVRFLGTHGKPDSAMLVRCIIQSQTGVYAAMITFIHQQLHVADWMCDEAFACESNIEGLTKLEAFVNEAQEGGVVTISEAEGLRHTMHHYQRLLMHHMEDVREGRAPEPVYAPPQKQSPSAPSNATTSHFGSVFGGHDQDILSGKKPARVGPSSGLSEASRNFSSGMHWPASKETQGQRRRHQAESFVSESSEQSHAITPPIRLANDSKPNDRE